MRNAYRIRAASSEIDKILKTKIVFIEFKDKHGDIVEPNDVKGVHTEQIKEILETEPENSIYTITIKNKVI